MSTLAEWRGRLSYQPLSLGIVALATSAALVVANQLTRPAIFAADERDLQTSLIEVLPEGFADNNLLKDTLTVTGEDGKPLVVYRARKAGAVTGAVFQNSARGYGGELIVLIGVDAKGTLLGARVIRHKETPGLGDKIELAKSQWIRDFEGKSLESPPPEQWAVKKDGGVFDQFAGATITPRAVVKAVHHALQYVDAHRAELFGTEDQPAEELAQ